MARKAFDPKAREKRQKMIAIGGFVLLLGLLALMGPKTWKMLHEKPPADESHAVATPPAGTPASPTLAPPTLSGGAGTPPAAAPSGGQLAEAQPPAPGDGQLVAFGRFQSKDPFVQQIEVSCEADPVNAATAACPVAGSTTPTETDTTETSTTSTTTTTVVVAPSTAVITLNGVQQTVDVGASFPAGDPTFKLVSLKRKSAKIGIVRGSFAGGGATVTLTLGKPLTLMNTADGTRYVLRLISVT